MTEQTPYERLVEVVNSDEYDNILNVMIEVRRDIFDMPCFPHVNALTEIMPRLKDVAIPAPVEVEAPPEE